MTRTRLEDAGDSDRSDRIEKKTFPSRVVILTLICVPEELRRFCDNGALTVRQRSTFKCITVLRLFPQSTPIDRTSMKLTFRFLPSPPLPRVAHLRPRDYNVETAVRPRACCARQTCRTAIIRILKVDTRSTVRKSYE